METNLIECLNDWTNLLDDKKCCDIIYFDFSKAFDRISLMKLTHKIKSLGFHPSLKSGSVSWSLIERFRSKSKMFCFHLGKLLAESLKERSSRLFCSTFIHLISHCYLRILGSTVSNSLMTSRFTVSFGTMTLFTCKMESTVSPAGLKHGSCR